MGLRGGARALSGEARKAVATVESVLAAGREPRTSPRSRLTLADRAAIQEGTRQGRSMRSIASELGLSHTAVSSEVWRGSNGVFSQVLLSEKRYHLPAAGGGAS
ncbi:helix-turn-helix domain-containing protein [Olsenella sp. Marseille-P4559]|uniref:helix-turn-helix domain-containing protein n=1 Tax=Olsenella sp. Marseille-P4559 TaxID=2364795 RepID=UPI0010325F39